MGWRPRDVYECTADEFEAAWLGWSRVHAPASGGTQFATAADTDNMLAWYTAKYG